MLCISAAYAVMRCLCVCPCVCLSRSWIMSKRINISSKFFHRRVAASILVFPYETGWRYSDGNTPNGSVECRWGWQKTRFWTNIWLRCIQVTVLSTVRVAKCEKQSRDERRQAWSTHRSVRRPLFTQDDNEVFVTGSTLYAGDGGQLGHNPVFCCRRTS